MANKINKNKKSKIDQNRFSNLIYSVTFLLIAVIITTYQVVTSLQNKKFKDEITDTVTKSVEKTIREETSSQNPDYSSLRNLKSLNIANNFESWTPNSNLEDEKVKTSVIVDKGRLSKGYIYIKASLDDGPLTKWESVYLKMNNIGGHLVRQRSLPVPGGDITELLYPLDNVYFYSRLPYTTDSPQMVTNYLSNFRPNSRVNIDVFISSLKPAKLHEVIIYYDCELNEECSLSLVK